MIADMAKESKGNVLFNCPVQGIADVISRKWSLLLVAVVGSRDSMRYKEIMASLTGISPKSLSDSLDYLSRAGILERRAYNEIPPRVEYSLTGAGVRLRNAVLPIIWWAIENASEKDCIIMKFMHR